MSADEPPPTRHRSRERLAGRDLQPQPSRSSALHEPPHPSQRKAPNLALDGVTVQPHLPESYGRVPAASRHAGAAALAPTATDAIDDSNPWSSVVPARSDARSGVRNRPLHPAQSDPHVAVPPARAGRASSRDRAHAHPSRLARSPTRSSYAEQAAARAAAGSGSTTVPRSGGSPSPSRTLSEAPSPSGPLRRPASASAATTAAGEAAVLREPRSEEERFERWKQNLHEYVRSPSRSPGGRRMRQGASHIAVGVADPPAGEHSFVASSVHPLAGQRRPIHPGPMPSASVSTSANGSVRSTPASSPHSSPSRVRPASSTLHGGPASRTAAAAPNSLARSLASLHKKVRSAPAGGRSGQAQQQPQKQTQRRDQSQAPDPRHSLEDVEAAFLAKLHSWLPAQPAAPTAESEPTLRSGSASSSLPAGQRMRRGAMPAASTAALAAAVPSDMQSEEEQIRSRARALAADMAALQNKKRAAFLAEQAAQLRVQSRLQVEERESGLRAQMEKKMIDFRERRDTSVHSCLQLQQDLRAKMAVLTAMDDKLTRRMAEVESGYASALDELQSEYAWTMESLYDAAAKQMESRLQQLQLQLQSPASVDMANPPGAEASAH